MVAFRAVKFTDVRRLTKPREILQHSSENPEFVRNFMSQYILYLCALNMGMVQNNYKINNYESLPFIMAFLILLFIHVFIHIFFTLYFKSIRSWSGLPKKTCKHIFLIGKTNKCGYLSLCA